nr:MAG TPA: hypothetical protein [Caudoviricetes sp.]
MNIFVNKNVSRETFFHVKHDTRYKIIESKGTQSQKLISDYLSMCVYINYNVRLILGAILLYQIYIKLSMFHVKH